MSIYDQVREQAFGMLGAVGALESLSVVSGTGRRKPYTCEGVISPPDEDVSGSEAAEYDVATGTVVLPPDAGRHVGKGTVIHRQTKDDNRDFKVVRVISRSEAAVVAEVTCKNLDNLYGMGNRQRIGEGRR